MPDDRDLPICSDYLEYIYAAGIRPAALSKWLNAVYITDITAEQIQQMEKWPFVERFEVPSQTKCKLSHTSNRFPCESFPLKQRDMIGADRLHLNGYIGTGLLICVMDNGFSGVPDITGFSHLFTHSKIMASKDFLSGSEDVYHSGNHGTSVLSNLAGYVPGALHGTAYGASYLLARTEIDSIESPLEMFLWTQAAEWADSIGADIFSTSLGYSQFDDPTKDYYYADMDGKTTLITQAAQIASEKGILVVNSAGNEGGKSWKYITAPGDADGVVTVGAVDSRGTIADFSSRGPTWDGRIKPNLVCQGVSNTCLGPSGDVYFASGTSFSCPVFSGLAACLWQVNRDLSAEALKQYIYRNCSKSDFPDNDYGRGIPDGAAIFHELTGRTLPPVPSCEILDPDGMHIYPIPATDYLYVTFDNRTNVSNISFEITDITGRFLGTLNYPAQRGLQQFELPIDDIHLTSGIYYIQLKGPDGYIFREQKFLVLR